MIVDQIALWIGRIILVVFGVAGAALIVLWPLDWIWKNVRNQAKFLDCLQIYVRQGRKAAKEAALAAKKGEQNA